jgi:protein-glucosylgalactosylhydroxylysine glucosidase
LPERALRAGADPLSPPALREYPVDFLPAYLSNGLIGLRVGRIPPLDGLCIVHGLIERDPIEDGEAFSRGPYPLAGEIVLGGHRLRDHPDRAVFREQAYDFSCGELRARFDFDTGDVVARVAILVFCDRTLPTLVAHETRVEVSADCDLALGGGLDPSGLLGEYRSRRTATPGAETPVVDGLMEWSTAGRASTAGAAYVTAFDGGEGAERHVEDLDRLAPLRTTYRVRARPGRRYVLRQVSSLISSQLHTEPDRQAARMAYLGAHRGFDRLRRDNRAAWAEIWRGRVRLVGADRRWQGIADASYYYLHASAHPSSPFSTSMFGLAYWPNYHYYRGHVMWDVEAFAHPVFLLTAPSIAEALLAYRFERMPAARRNATMNGYQGLQFPWASSPAHGEEVIRLSRPDVVFEQHVNLVVAHAFARHWQATGDDDFARERAWPVLRGVARWIESRTTPTVRGYEIRECLGIAEQEAPADNHAYVNLLAAEVLRQAAELACRLARPGADGWRAMAARMFVPMARRGGVVLNHDGWRFRAGDPVAATPESLAAIFPFDCRLDAGVERRTLRHYLDRVDAYVGRPMLSAPLGTWAAMLGDRERSGRLFEAGYAAFVDEPFRVVNEFSLRFPDRPRAGPLIANIGGFLTGCLYGLTGLSLGPDEPERWPRRPAAMPDLWDGIEVERIWVRGQPVGLSARHGEPARFEPFGEQR